MQLISLGFILFWIVLLILFYKFKHYQWQILLGASMIFYILYSSNLPIILIICTMISYLYGCYLKKGRDNRGILAACIASQLLILMFYKYLTGLAENLTQMQKIVMPLGLSFFVLISIGYCIDIHREKYVPETNYAKLLLCFSFFPSIIQGPINRYDNVSSQLCANYRQLNWKNFYWGIQRFLWGIMKKLVIVPRLGLVVDRVYGGEPTSAISIMFGTVCFAIQLYADFSGYMDMVLGVSETLGIKLVENFKRPFFSTSVAEFWRRWHISLGTWFKDYVMFSFVMSETGRKIKKGIQKYNKKIGKMLPMIIGTLLVWIFTGIWHGNSLGYFLWGIYYGVIISASVLRDDKKKTTSTYINKILCCLRTYIIVLIADVFIEAGTWENIKLFFLKLFDLKGWMDIVNLINVAKVMGIKDYLVLFVAILIWFIVSILQERGYHIREIVEKLKMPIRWMLWYAAIFFIIAYGMYGQRYDASAFMYQNF